ncbi:hypothetical protein HHK36_027713 [Tetracentron sinense]|uniref:Pentatricopeptide repeat-containing protein n=1 Tax=Tetracentron sinense TaxID=13715 RepID=A0A835D3S8_TETSI|nr:hypothetical protein HHK36_027713 [Tetracentron sinense]
MSFLRSWFSSFVPIGKNHIFNPLLRERSITHISTSRNLCFESSFRSSYKLFEEISQINGFVRNSKSLLHYSTSPEKYGEFGDSRQVFGENQRVISWTATISSLTRRNQPGEAIGVFKLMLINELRPNFVTVLSVMRAVGEMNLENMAREIHGFVIKLGFESEVSIATALLGLYSIHYMETAWQLFDQIPIKDLVLWSAMVAACSKNRQFVEAFEIFREMQYFGIEPNHVSVVSVLPACADLGALSFGKQIHGYSIKKEFSSLTNVKNSLVDMYAKCGNLEASILVFNWIHKKDLVSWNTMIHGCMENGSPRKALDMFSKMRSSYIQPDETTIRTALGACSQAEQLKFGFMLHSYILKNGLLPSISIGTALLRMYADFGDVGSARTLFNHFHKKDVIAWSAMISVYARAGHPYYALDTFKQMQVANEKPNEITLVSLLQACSLIEAQEHGKSIHAHTVRGGYTTNAFITSALIDLYCKFGRLGQGKTLFDKLLNKDLICWSSMINGYGMNGCGEEALKTFSNMLECGTKPNDIVFVSLLSACSHCGLEDEGWRWFYCMEEKYGITPTLAHYACMVDLLSRRGHIEEALEFVNKMPVEPDTRVWGSLLTGCKLTCGAIEVAEFAAERLLSLDPKNTSYYVILSNLYAEHGLWNDVERLRSLVNEKGLRKTAGYSMVKAN